MIQLTLPFRNKLHGRHHSCSCHETPLCEKNFVFDIIVGFVMRYIGVLWLLVVRFIRCHASTRYNNFSLSHSHFSHSSLWLFQIYTYTHVFWSYSMTLSNQTGREKHQQLLREKRP